MPKRSIESNGSHYVLDVRPDRLDLRDRSYSPPTISLPTQYPEPQLLAEFFPKYIEQNLILDQGEEGACTGFGLAAVINYLLWLRALNINALNKFRTASPHMLYDLARFYDEWPGQSYDGSSCRGAMKGWHKHGVCESELWISSIHTRKNKQAKKNADSRYLPDASWALDASKRPVGVYYRVDKRSVTDMQAAIKDVGAIYVSCYVHSGWKIKQKKLTPKGFLHGAIPRISFDSKEKITGGHAFCLVGFNEDGFIVQNSWGQRWGLSGFAVISYEDWVANGIDAWVCALGVPQTPRTKEIKENLQLAVSRRASNASLLTSDVAVKVKPTDLRATPWTTQRATQCCVIAGNDGLVEVSRPDIGEASDMIKSVMVTPVLEWLANQASLKPKIMIYAHGGLNTEEEAIQRARVMGPYFLENGIYPIFYVWKTGIGETLKDELSDKLSPQQTETISAGLLSEARDALIETLAHGPLRWAWRQMKQNAELAVESGHAIDLMVNSLAELRKEKPTLEIHLVGHSAGSFVHGRMLEAMKKKSINADSLTLYAPACSLEFALDKFTNTKIPNDKIWLHILSDKNERSDYVHNEQLYGKSLLYLVGRGFEENRKTPLAGLERTVNSTYTEPDDDLWDKKYWSQVKKWRAWINALPLQEDNKPACEILTSQSISTGGKSISAAHGSFDNDIEVVTRTIKRLLNMAQGDKLNVEVEDLNF
jgi:Papain family cysteine protease